MWTWQSSVVAFDLIDLYVLGLGEIKQQHKQTYRRRRMEGKTDLREIAFDQCMAKTGRDKQKQSV